MWLPLGKELKRLREEAGLTQRQLAQLAGVSQSLISRIECGTADPRASTLRRILTALAWARREVKVKEVMHSPVVTVDALDTVEKAVDVMEKLGISQIPVLDDGKVVGCIYESSLLKALRRSGDPLGLLKMRALEVMEEPLPMLNPQSSLEEAYVLLLSGKPAVLIVEQGRPVGIVTKIDIVAKMARLQPSSSRA
ncbi:MAG: CBS domain-containing protein [Candidatus Nezhaarchaeota archaeon]|nr:CBS domain-containing protein [Candidatus Nezhaarchaeota archaeon]